MGHPERVSLRHPLQAGGDRLRPVQGSHQDGRLRTGGAGRRDGRHGGRGGPDLPGARPGGNTDLRGERGTGGGDCIKNPRRRGSHRADEKPGGDHPTVYRRGDTLPGERDGVYGRNGYSQSGNRYHCKANPVGRPVHPDGWSRAAAVAGEGTARPHRLRGNHRESLPLHGALAAGPGRFQRAKAEAERTAGDAL